MSDLREAVRAFLWSDGQERADTLAALMKAYDESAAQTPAADAGLDEFLREALSKAIHAVYLDHGQQWIGPDDAKAILAKMTEHKRAALAQTPAADAGLEVERLARAFRALSPWRDDETFLDVWHGEAVDLAREYEALR